MIKLHNILDISEKIKLSEDSKIIILGCGLSDHKTVGNNHILSNLEKLIIFNNIIFSDINNKYLCQNMELPIQDWFKLKAEKNKLFSSHLTGSNLNVIYDSQFMKILEDNKLFKKNDLTKLPNNFSDFDLIQIRYVLHFVDINKRLEIINDIFNNMSLNSYLCVKLYFEFAPNNEYIPFSENELNTYRIRFPTLEYDYEENSINFFLKK